LFHKFGEGIFFTTDGKGNIGTLKAHTDWQWDYVNSAGLMSNGFSGLVQYKDERYIRHYRE